MTAPEAFHCYCVDTPSHLSSLSFACRSIERPCLSDAARMSWPHALRLLVGAFIVRIPAPGWKPEGYTPQFWCIWVVLCVNVTAGIGVLSQASAMSQEMFPGEVGAVVAAGFVGLMSLFNMGGRFFWASTS